VPVPIESCNVSWAPSPPNYSVRKTKSTVLSLDINKFVFFIESTFISVSKATNIVGMQENCLSSPNSDDFKGGLNFRNLGKSPEFPKSKQLLG
jgi:hypothetical protein